MKETWITWDPASTTGCMMSQPVQSILTKYGCTIRTRLGLHEIADENVSDWRDVSSWN